MKDANLSDSPEQLNWTNESRNTNKLPSNQPPSLNRSPHTVSSDGIWAASSLSMEATGDFSESEGDVEWEEIDVMGDGTTPSGLLTQDVEVVIQNEAGKTKRRVPTFDPLQRTLRLESHKMHTVALLASFGIRNKWINDSLLHARLLSMTPLPLQTSFSMIHRKNEPDASRRARLFLTASFRLTEWWHSRFQVVMDSGIRSQTYLEVEHQRKLHESRQITTSSEASDTELVRSDRLRTAKSLMKHALTKQGSADTSAILFTALCRALGIPTRLIVSLQSVPWSSKSEKIQDNNINEDVFSDSDSGKVETTTSGPHVKKQRKGRRGRNGHSITASADPPLEGWPPVVWTEVFSRPEGRWIPIDPIRYLIDKKRLFEPPPNCRINRMMYVVAFEEDGYIRDVTLRYARHFGAKTSKARASSRRGQSDWWESVIALFTRPYRLNRDDIEDAELQSLQHIEGMPTSVGGFKDHPLYALERHLRRDEVIHPLHEIGRFRGEPVYPRSNVQRLRSSETWMREGRIIKEGQQPLKRVVQRAHTINGRRALEFAKADGLSEPPTQGLYAEWQTELYVPEPVTNGKIPKNNFGNINLFTPSMLPSGAVHIPIQNIAKVARQLGIDHAPAVTGFEFRKGHANPIVNGIVIAAENEDIVVSAYWESEQAAQEAERVKRHERVMRRWTRLVQGLRVRKRLIADYGTMHDPGDTVDPQPAPAPGGFLTEYDGVIEHFDLPKTHVFRTETTPTIPVAVEEDEPLEWSVGIPESSYPVISQESVTTTTPVTIPKSLRERGKDYFNVTKGQPQSPSHPLPNPHSTKRRRVRTRGDRRVSSFRSSSHDIETSSESEHSSKRARTGAQSAPRRQLRPRKK